MAKRTAIYARVSTSDQSPEMQLAILREHAERRGLTVVKEYVDHVTGNVERRQRERSTKANAYHQLLMDAHRKQFDIVLVWKFDRFARSLSALVAALQTFSELGIDFISCTEAMDTTTPIGRLLFCIVGSFAEFERTLIVERTKAGIANARKRGVIVGRPRDRDAETQILNLRSAGVSFRKIAAATGRSLAGVVLVCGREKRNA